MAISFANREVCDLTFCDYATKKPIHRCDYANTSSQELTGEATYAYGGKGHPKRVTFYGEKGGTLTVETQIQTAELYSIMTGAAVETSAKFLKRQELEAAEHVLTLHEGVTLEAGSVNVYAADDDCGTPLEVTVSGSSITLPEDAAGTFIVYGLETMATGVKKMNIKSTTFPKALTIYGETFMKGEDDVIYPYKMVAYKAAPQQTFSLSFSNSGDPASLTLTFDLLADGDDNILDLILEDDK